jgi:hypothetical protein
MLLRLTTVAIACLALSPVTFAQQKTMAPAEFVQWLPITDAEKELKAPKVEKDAGVEALLWRVHVVDEIVGAGTIQRVSYNYARLKVFDEKGKEAVSTIDLFYGEHGDIVDVAGRTIKPDGSIVELASKSIFRRDVVRTGGFRRKSVSFAMPAIEPGVIIEYRWRQVLDDNRIRFTRLEFQREFPVEKMTYFVKGLDRNRVVEETYLMPFNCKPSPIKYEMDGYASTSVENIPALRGEPWSPGQWNDGPWALLYYTQGTRKNPDKYWQDVGKEEYQKLKASLRVDDALKTATAEAISGAKNDQDKVDHLIAYLRKNLRDFYGGDVTDAERSKIYASMPKERERTAPEIFRSGIGYSGEMNVVFAAMASQAGLEARPALVSDRLLPFDPKVTTETYFLPNVDMAIKIGQNWQVYDVSRKNLPPGMLSWTEEGQMALLADPKTPTFIHLPDSIPDFSVESRGARFELSADGHIEGEVTEVLSGHKAEEYRSAEGEKAMDEQENQLKDRLSQMFVRAEVSSIRIVNVDDVSKPVELHYHLRAEFAQGTGKRLLIQPIAFRRAMAAPFSSASRRRAIDFHYGWAEVDNVTIKIPAGFVFDSPDAPPNLTFGKAGGYEVKMTINKTTNELSTNRQLRFGAEGATFFLPQDYATIKKVFDDVHSRDTHTIALKQAE